MRISFDELFKALRNVLLKTGFDAGRAELCARLFTETTCDGVYSHGLNRFPRFLRMIENGSVNINAEPTLVSAFGSLERWDGNRGPGNLNAFASMERAIELAATNGIGCIALANTNHWMRGGSYGWQAADAGMIGICWTNTLPNLPPWGAKDPRLGNNPLVIAVSRSGGHVVLDMAMSQFSYGSLEAYRKRREDLPVAGGYDSEGKLSCDAAEIEKSGRPLPIGFWKGSGLALILDLIAAGLSGGRSTHQIPAEVERETAISQFFLAINASANDHHEKFGEIADQIITSVKANGGDAVRYPGEKTRQVRLENMQNGIPVDEEIWNFVKTKL